jgi:dGTPase
VRLLDERDLYRSSKAALSANSRGRKKPIIADPYRTEYLRDVHRIIYSQPFRRLRHKTQVFFLPNNDHICTRIEHSLHVSSAARTVARRLGLNEDLAEAIGLGHDMGHAPFGHHGEDVLKRLSKDHGLNVTFQHEMHGLRVVDRLALLDREPESGLNLTYEVRDGIISHCGEDFSREIVPESNYKDLESISSREEALTPCTFEGCIVRVVDKIAYSGRDVEDALAAGLIKESEIPADVVGVLGKNNGEIVGTLLQDLIDYCDSHRDRVGLSEEKHQALVKLIAFNIDNIYHHAKVERFKKQATRAIEELFNRLVEDLRNTKGTQCEYGSTT